MRIQSLGEPLPPLLPLIRILRATVLTGLLAAFASPVAAQQPGAPGLADRVRQGNAKVLEAMARAEAAPGQGVRQEALRILLERAEALGELMQSDPVAALSLAFSGELPGRLAALFPEAAESIESEGSWSGPVEYEVTDDETLTSSWTLARMKLGDEDLQIRFAGQDPEGLQCGDNLEVRGFRLGHRVVAAEATILGAGDNTKGAPRSAAGARTASACSTLGTQRIAVLLVTFPGVTAPNLTTTGVWNVLFGSSGRTLNTYWRDASYGQTSATGDVFGWYTLDKLYSCDQTYEMRAAAIAAADADVNFQNYTRIFLLFPNPGSCSFAGRANVGCMTVSSPGDGSFTASTAWMLASYFSGENGAKLAAHEGGHNLTLMHSRSRDFGADSLGSLGAAGTIGAYGDINANMGSWNWGHYPVQQKDKIGWLGSGGVITVQNPGSYSILPLEIPATGLRGLKVQRGTGNNAWLWLEYRQPVGSFDSTLNSQIFTGATVHYVDSTTGSYTDLLDFTPSTSSFADPALAAGRTWVDPYTNVSLTVDSADASALNVTVNYGSLPCTAANPTVSLSPGNPSITAGSTANYTLTVTNNDSAGCTDGVFSLSSSGPEGWSGILAATSLSISPGTSASTTLSETPPAGTIPGTYSLSASATKGPNSGVGTASLTVILACNAANPTVLLSPVSATVAPGGSTEFALTVTNNDSAGCSAGTYNLSSSKPGGWTATLGSSSLTLAPGTSGSTTLAVVTRSSTSPSTYSVSASAAKGSFSGTGTASVIVALDTSCTAANPTVSLSPASQSVLAGASATFTVNVTNNDSSGCSAGTFSLSAAAPSGWTAALDSSSLAITPGSSGSATLTVTPPSGTAASTYPVSITAAKGGYSGSGTASVTVTAPLCTAANPTVSLSPASQSVLAGGSVTFTMSVTNNDSSGCSTGTFTLSAAAPSGWTAMPAASSLTISPGASGSTTLTVTPPSGTAASTYPVNGSAAKGGYSGSGTASVTVTAPLCTAANPTVSLSPASQSVLAGGSVTFTMSVTNNDSSGCSGGAFTLSAAAPSGWTATLAASSLTISPGAGGSTLLTVTPPAGTTAATYPLSVTAAKGSYSAGASASVTVTAPVCTTADPSVVISPANPSANAGSGVSYTVTITNNDSASCSSSTFTLSSAQPDGWTTSFSSGQVSLAPGQSVAATMTKQVPASAAPGAYPVNAAASRQSSSGSGQATCTVLAPPPSLSASVSVAGTSFTSRDAVPITATVLSGGSPVRASVIFTVTKPDGSQTTKSANTDAQGKTTWSYRFGPKDPAGTYSVTVQATYGGQTATSSAATFALQ